MKSHPWWRFLLMTNHSFQFFKIRIIQYHSLTMILIKLVIGVIHGKCLLTQILQNKHKNWFFQGSVQKKIILPYISIIYQSPRLPFKSITRQALVALYKAFIRPHLGYGGIVCDKPNNQVLINKIKASLLKMGRPHANSTYTILDSIGIKLSMRLHLDLSHLNEHKFRHNFVDCANPLCFSSIKPETRFHFFYTTTVS